MSFPGVCLSPWNKWTLLRINWGLSHVQGHVILHVNSNLTGAANKVKKNGHLLPQQGSWQHFNVVASKKKKKYHSFLLLNKEEHWCCAHSTRVQSVSERIKTSWLKEEWIYFTWNTSVLLQRSYWVRIKDLRIKTGGPLHIYSCWKVNLWVCHSRICCLMFRISEVCLN